MAAPVTPTKKLSNGKDHWWLVPAVAAASAPTVAEVNTATGLTITGSLLADYEGITSSTSKVTLPRVLIETTETEIPGTTTFSAGDMVCLFHPQGATGSDGKKAWEKVKDGFVGYAIRRQDVASPTSDAVTTGQFVDVVPVELGAAIPGKTSTGADGVYVFTAPVSITGAPRWNVAVAT